jgi:ribonuclease PH
MEGTAVRTAEVMGAMAAIVAATAVTVGAEEEMEGAAAAEAVAVAEGVAVAVDYNNVYNAPRQITIEIQRKP